MSTDQVLENLTGIPIQEMAVKSLIHVHINHNIPNSNNHAQQDPYRDARSYAK